MPTMATTHLRTVVGKKNHIRTFMLIYESSKRGVAEKSTLQVQA
jgi:hypothetical protein